MWSARPKLAALAVFAFAAIALLSGCTFGQDPTAEITVYVNDASGSPVDGAYVTVYSSYSFGTGIEKTLELGGTITATDTTKNGRATFNITPGNYAFKASKDGAQGDAEQLIVSSQSSITIRLKPKEGIVTAEICTNGRDDDSDGKTDCLDEDCSGNAACTGGEMAADAGKEYRFNANREAKLSANASGGREPYSYQWSINADLQNCSIDDPTLKNPAVRCIRTGESEITLTVKDSSNPAKAATSKAALFSLAPPVELCGNGSDDDGDGSVDCADFSCYASSACIDASCKGYPAGDDKIEGAPARDIGLKSISALSALETVKATTDQLLGNGKSPGVAPQSVGTLRAISLKRKAAMLELAQSQPSLFLLNAMSEKDRQSLPENVSANIEKKEVVEGTLRVFENPHLSPGKSKESESAEPFAHTIRTTGKLEYALKFADNTGVGFVSEQKVVARGVALENVLVAKDGEPENVKVTQNPPANENLGELKFAVILAKTPGTSDPEAVDKIKSNIQYNKKILEEMAYGKSKFTFDVYGWYEVKPKSPDYTSDIDILKVAEAAGVDFSGYGGIMIVDKGQCFGCAIVGKIVYDGELAKYSGKWYSWYSPSAFDIDGFTVVSHELGHNLGLHHANKLECNGAADGDFSDCTHVEYGDSFDTMGSADGQHFNLPYKKIIGWIDAGKIITADKSGIYTINPIEKDSGILGIQIPRKVDESGKAEQFYYLELRLPIGSDEHMLKSIKKGIQLRIQNHYYENGTTHHFEQAGGEVYPLTGIISEGESFTDRQTGTSVKLMSISVESAKVEISLPNLKCTRSEPEFTVAQAKINAKPGQTAYLNAKITNRDSVACSDRQIYVEHEKGKEREYEVTFYSPTGVFYAGNSKEEPVKIASGQTINAVVTIHGSGTQGDFAREIALYEKGKKIASRPVTLSVLEKTDSTDFFGKDMAIRFKYDQSSEGYYLLDKNGKLYAVGNANNVFEDPPAMAAPARAVALDALEGGFLTMYSAGKINRVGLSYTSLRNGEVKAPTLACNIAADFRAEGGRIRAIDAYGNTIGIYYEGAYPIKCLDRNEKKVGFSTPEVVRALFSGKYENRQENEFYILTRKGEIYACNGADESFTRLKQPFSPSEGKYPVALALQQGRGIVMLDSFGNIYTSGTAQNTGAPNFGFDNARDLQIFPDGTGYGVLSADGKVYAYKGLDPPEKPVKNETALK
ncbi:MAG: hypothetical protein HY544_04715 [Candidatus Diapherotrites archaeon]|uniref:Uncharacterized protein n=1 Tax=Candidatus Iainarchaeum sp. TaxID=3101447 RepID=A0A8T3YM42_9ARCH|nr:hypothetical protein [Candidatus Diapherotrites archaeon]